MATPTLFEIDESNANQAVQIADRIWWVGHYLPGDPFQCHVYLIEHGDQSVLIDPGSKLTFNHSLKKIESVIPLANIRYFICHHQDPDITGCLPLIDQLLCRDDCLIVSHWRAIALLKHYGLNIPFLCVEKNNWQLDLGGRKLDFIFTPYLHFSGAFCSFDGATGVLFSSDLFGGFTEKWRLVAQDESHFEAIRPFHEHYMPSREILYHGLRKLENHSIKTIAPQHGSIIPQPLVKFMFDQLKNIDCGTYLMTQTSTDVHRLSLLNKILRKSMQIMVLHRDFAHIAQSLFEQVNNLMAVESLEFYAWSPTGEVIHLLPENLYRGVHIEPTSNFCAISGLDLKQWNHIFTTEFVIKPCNTLCGREASNDTRPALMIPLFSQETGKLHATAVFILSQPIEISGELAHILEELSLALSVAVEREMLQRGLDAERQRFYEISIHDPLTGLYTRTYMNEAAQRLLDIHDRDANAGITVAVFDIDHFKAVNDTFGHNTGDTVLKHVAAVLRGKARRGDIAVRMGGEEFAVFIAGSNQKTALEFAERIRLEVASLRFDGSISDLLVTISCGVAQHRQKETIAGVLERADKALYESKRTGRNRVCVAPE